MAVADQVTRLPLPAVSLNYPMPFSDLFATASAISLLFTVRSNRTFLISRIYRFFNFRVIVDQFPPKLSKLSGPEGRIHLLPESSSPTTIIIVTLR